MRRTLRRAACLLLCFILPTLALSENVGDSLVVGILCTKTYELRPLTPQDRGMLSLYDVIYESLVAIDDNGLPQPKLAQSWEKSNGGKTWTFTLRENVTFSDGTPLRAADVVASGQYILNLAQNEDASARGFYANMRYMVASMTAKDDSTVVVKTDRGYYGLLYSMTFPVVPASQVDMTAPIGTGPYVIQGFEPGSYLKLTANERWWQTEPKVKEIMAMIYTSNKDMITDFEYGKVDCVFTRSVAAAQYKSGINSLSIAYSTRQLEALLMCHTSYPLDSVKVRQAIRCAINKEQISKNVYMNMTVNADTPISSDSWLYCDQESEYAYNPEKARQLLAEDGWSYLDDDDTLDKVSGDSTKHLVLRLYVYEDPENDVRFQSANLISDYLKAIGIYVNISTMSYSEILTPLEKGSFDLALVAFQMDVVPDPGFFLRSGNSQNYCRYKSSEMTTLITTLRTNQEQADFYYTMQAVQQQFTNDAPFVCLFYRSGAILTRKMYTTVRDIREFELLRGIASFGR